MTELDRRVAEWTQVALRLGGGESIVVCKVSAVSKVTAALQGLGGKEGFGGKSVNAGVN